MKCLTKLIFVITILNSNLFANNGFELFLNIPIGANINMNPYYELKTDRINKYLGKVNAGFDTGIGLQLGYSKKINKKFSFSFLGNIAYNYSICYIENPKNKDSEINNITLGNIHYYLHNLKIGIAPKINHNNFSYTLGLGMIIPINIKELRNINNNSYIYQSQRISALAVAIYTDFAFDYSIFITKKMAVTVGTYTGVDCYDIVKSKEFPQSQSALFVWNIGIRFGFRFAPYNFY